MSNEVESEDVFNQPPPKALTRHEADHLRQQLFQWSMENMNDDQFVFMMKRFRLPLMVTLRNLLDGESPMEEG